MKIIEQSAEIIQPTGYDLDSIYQDIERAARTSYKSTPKGDAKGFVDKLIASKHHSPLEFGTVYLHIKRVSEGANQVLKYICNPYSEVVDTMTEAFITTNLRVIKERHWEDDLKYMCEPTERHVKRYTLHCITSIGVTRELNRHRRSSIIEQSTRYCNYSKDKFGGEISVVRPPYVDTHIGKDAMSQKWSDAMNMADDFYMYLLGKGWKPQEARGVLPLDTATEVMYCMFEDDLKHLLDLRVLGTTGAPHPQVKALLTPIYEQLKDVLYV